ncbi:MAG: DUF6314 family protein [Maritimibacter sp.]
MPELRDFEGNWQIARRIEDARAGQVSHFEGHATFTPDGAGMAYHEVGRLSLPGATPMQAERRYLWRAAPGGIAVLYEDERPFHLIRAGEVQPEDSHDCAPDRYHVRYDFRLWPDWQMIWQVDGPRKSYLSLTKFHRPG